MKQAEDQMGSDQRGRGLGVTVSGQGLCIKDLIQCTRWKAPVKLTTDAKVWERMDRACSTVLQNISRGGPLYGVTTSFGAQAEVFIPQEQAASLQANIAWPHKTGAGDLLPDEDVRAAMLLRVNSLLHGLSGVRPVIVQRLVDCLNHGITPHVHELGSIGASGDLVPLASILGAVIGLDPAYKVNWKGQSMPAPQALQQAGMEPLSLQPKEGLSVMNGTSVMTGIAATCVQDAWSALALTLAGHALMHQGLQASNQSLHPLVHTSKPHRGQVAVAGAMRDLLDSSALVRDELDGSHQLREQGPVQDRYSLRCLPQYMGPVVDGLGSIAGHIEVEMNSATDNPLVDAEHSALLYCGNFLGQYVALGMDQLRSFLGFLAKHLDVQIALLVTPEFNNGLSGSLVGNPERKVNLGLKGLQITANSIMPLLSFYGNSLADRFPTHAEQFNQNINSQGFGAAVLARKAMGLMQQYTAIALLFGIQAVDLRTKALFGHFDARRALSPSSARVYEAVHRVLGISPQAGRPYVFNDDEQCLDAHIAKLAQDISGEGSVVRVVQETVDRLQEG
ncbi:MAG: aromatic amino acid ammonia-lyase [Desulfovermiculus sp.]